jgi:hypothetical protein
MFYVHYLRGPPVWGYHCFNPFWRDYVLPNRSVSPWPFAKRFPRRP